MYTYFVLANEREIARMKSIDDVLSHIEQFEPMLGGNVSQQAISSLSKLFLQGERRMPSPSPYSLADGSRFYIVDAELCERMALAEHEQLLNASVHWSEDEPWKDTHVNPMDLAGFILDMVALWRQAEGKRSLFILFDDERPSAVTNYGNI